MTMALIRFRHHGVFAANNFRNSRIKLLIDPLHSHHKEGAAHRQAFAERLAESLSQ
jgi:hypothetical protein